MKKIVFCLLFLLVLLPFTNGQSVDSIKVEQAGDLIKINYKILNSTSYQTFRVSVFCSINGGLEARLRSISGDFGDNVVGGRDDYMILWDVLKDADNVNSVEFSVRAELVNDATPKNTNALLKVTDPQKYWSRERFFILVSAAAGKGHFLAGGRIAYMGNWGFSIALLTGNRKYNPPFAGKVAYDGTLSHLDITKRIVNKNSSQIHLIAGFAFGEHNGYTNPQPEFKYGYDIGIVAGVGRTALYAGYSTLLRPFTDDGDNNGTPSFNFGMGVRF